ncbi:hypothetical protein FISHEDRAFT_62512 [Fistulina hepatica ATCC 64428]|nr:hypothetical protein FISHEDRAFT_62512 [Fistulina hepatica ATCC 64428]
MQSVASLSNQRRVLGYYVLKLESVMYAMGIATSTVASVASDKRKGVASGWRYMNLKCILQESVLTTNRFEDETRLMRTTAYLCEVRNWRAGDGKAEYEEFAVAEAEAELGRETTRTKNEASTPHSSVPPHSFGCKNHEHCARRD